MFSANAKKDSRTVLAWRWFFRHRRRLGRGRAVRRRLVHCDFRHVGGDVQRSSTRSLSSAPIANDTDTTEKSIWPIGGMIRRTGFKIGSHSRVSKRTPGAYPPGETKLVNA